MRPVLVPGQPRARIRMCAHKARPQRRVPLRVAEQRDAPDERDARAGGAGRVRGHGQRGAVCGRAEHVAGVLGDGEQDERERAVGEAAFYVCVRAAGGGRRATGERGAWRAGEERGCVLTWRSTPAWRRAGLGWVVGEPLRGRTRGMGWGGVGDAYLRARDRGGRRGRASPSCRSGTRRTRAARARGRLWCAGRWIGIGRLEDARGREGQALVRVGAGEREGGTDTGLLPGLFRGGARAGW